MAPANMGASGASTYTRPHTAGFNRKPARPNMNTMATVAHTEAANKAMMAELIIRPIIPATKVPRG